MKKPVVLVVQDYFLPGFKGGGSLRSVAHIVGRTCDEFRFDILTRDRDFTDSGPYEGLRPGWNERGDCRVLYLTPSQITPWGIDRILRNLDYDLLYLNSFFSTLTVFVLSLRRLRRLPERPVVLAPRGELAADALSLKATKKAAYLWLARRISLLRGVIWHASTELEAEEIRRLFDGTVEVAMDPPACGAVPSERPPLPAKIPGQARFVFLSRVARKKNLAKAIDLLDALEGNVVFDIYGPLEDPRYWRECESLIASLPANVRCSFAGEIPHDEIGATLSRYHFFLFPTLNENFGHVVLEALAAGLPPILSDRTPWTGLEDKGAGFDFPLADDARFRACLRRCVAMPEDEHRRMSARAAALAAAFMRDPRPVDQTRDMFRRALRV